MPPGRWQRGWPRHAACRSGRPRPTRRYGASSPPLRLARSPSRARARWRGGWCCCRGTTPSRCSAPWSSRAEPPAAGRAGGGRPRPAHRSRTRRGGRGPGALPGAVGVRVPQAPRAGRPARDLPARALRLGPAGRARRRSRPAGDADRGDRPRPAVGRRPPRPAAGARRGDRRAAPPGLLDGTRFGELPRAIGRPPGRDGTRRRAAREAVDEAVAAFRAPAVGARWRRCRWRR